jgi:hypothetical protein
MKNIQQNNKTTIKWAKKHKYFGTPLYKYEQESIKANGGNSLKIKGEGNCKHCR